MTTPGKYLGIYRGTVVNNIDPMQLGRIMVIVPDVGGVTPSSWAMPCVPLAGKQMGTFMVPQIGAGVWVQFENGDPDMPVWVGGWWGIAAEVPALALAGVPADPNIVIQSTLQNAIVVSDLPGPTGGIMLKSTTGATIIVNDTGIYIQNGKGASIIMTGPTVTINNGALVVV
ncbi:MAG: baseplate assembly protein [Alphaproteobacteria bacterium]|nr:baseplate assembly protein [Alphaproteobacteria bacterium]